MIPGLFGLINESDGFDASRGLILFYLIFTKSVWMAAVKAVSMKIHRGLGVVQ